MFCLDFDFDFYQLTEFFLFAYDVSDFDSLADLCIFSILYELWMSRLS